MSSTPVAATETSAARQETSAMRGRSFMRLIIQCKARVPRGGPTYVGVETRAISGLDDTESPFRMCGDSGEQLIVMLGLPRARERRRIAESARLRRGLGR